MALAHPAHRAGPMRTTVAPTPPAKPTHTHPQTTGAIRQKYVEKDHLAFRYTCLDWLRGLAWNDKVSGPCDEGRKGPWLCWLGVCAVGSRRPWGAFDKMRKSFSLLIGPCC